MATIIRGSSPHQYTHTYTIRQSTAKSPFKTQMEWDRYFDALLADLQNTISPAPGVPAAGTSGYGSLNGSRARDQKHPTSDYGTTSRTVITERYESQMQPQNNPTYQNQRVIQETVTTSKMSYPQSPPVKNVSLNSNLSELDTLLQDLSNAHYAGYVERRDGNLVNGSTRPPCSQETRARPSVDSLLDELNAPVPNGDVPDGRPHTTTITMQEMQQPPSTDPGYPGDSSTRASSATKELDILMASLADFKINAGTHQHQTVTDSPYAKPNKATKSSPSPQTTVNSKQNQLDSMLGNLQADMSRQGVNTTQKGCCSACDKPIVGQVITALGKTWHPEHFTCNHCNQELGTRNFFERDGHPYCEPDYHNLFSPRCAYCNGPILDKCVTALEKTWHTEHFFCAQCGKQFGEEGFHERDGKPYCRDDYFDMFAPKCGGCNRPIMENYISALNSQWHADCFVCRDCKKPVTGKSFYAMEGKPVCPKCVGIDEDDGNEEGDED